MEEKTEAKERTAEARGERAFSEETESHGNTTNLKTDVNAYDTTRGFLGTTARRTRRQRKEVGGVFQTPGPAAEMFELRGQIVSRTGSAEAPPRVSKRVSTGAAAASQEVSRVSQAAIPWRGHWRWHLQFISVKVQGASVRLAAAQRGLHLLE